MVYYKHMYIRILGCGHSFGTPTASGQWNKCSPKENKNYRTRSSIFIEYQGRNMLIDAGPDLRYQCIKNNITNIDEVFITHSHADHILGINDLQTFAYKNKKKIIIHVHECFVDNILSIFSYCIGKYIILKPFKIKPELYIYNNINIIKQNHGKSISYGIRLGNIAYCVDISSFAEEEFQKLQGVQLLMIGCIDYIDHMSHAGLDKVKKWIDIINPQRAIITHMNNNMNYQQYICDKIEMAYDSMTINADYFLEY